MGMGAKPYLGGESILRCGGLRRFILFGVLKELSEATRASEPGNRRTPYRRIFCECTPTKDERASAVTSPFPG